MICQLKIPALFISQSAAETKWPELLRALGQTVDNKAYTDTEIAQMDFETKSRLIRGDSATLVRYFDHQFNVFLKDVIFSKCKPIGEIIITFGEKSLLQEVLFMSTGLHMSKMPLYMVKYPIVK